MSVQAMGWVFDHSPTAGSDRLVLLSIANHAGTSPVDGAWEAWPGIALLQREAGLKRANTLNESLARLVERGHLERVVNGAPDSRMRPDRRPNLYRILLGNGVPCSGGACSWCGVPESGGASNERGPALPRHGVPDRVPTGSRFPGPKPLVEPSLEPEISRGDPFGNFERFWDIYPRKVAKEAAKKAWDKAFCKAPPVVIIDGARRYRDDPNRDPAFTAHPATWLNGGRWTDEPLPPRVPTTTARPDRRVLEAMARAKAREGRR